jgi:hypothetical protein
MSFNVRHNTKKGGKPFKSTHHGKTRRVQRGGAPRAVMKNGKPIGEYDDETGEGSAEYEAGRYDGHFLDGVPHGQGKFTYNDGSVYEGECAHDELNGRGKMTYSDGDVYEGEWLNNQMNGKGIMTYAIGSTYDGDWLNGQKNGRGTIEYADDGRVYEGEWQNDQMHGHGKLTYADGNIYEGEWQNDAMHGRGMYTFKTGKVYNGELRNNNFDGRGTMTYADGRTYEGDWADDERNGRGIEKDAAGIIRYDGEWQNDQKHGRGMYTFEDNTVYDGEWADDAMNGQGKMTYYDGSTMYEGTWAANLMHGHGKMTYPDGSVYEGPWDYESRHGENGRMRYADGRVYEGEWWKDNMHGDGTMTAANGDVTYEGLWRDNHENRPLFDPVTGELADNAEYNAQRPPKIFPISDNMLYQSDTYKYKYHDMMELQDRNVLEALEEDPDAIALKVNRTYYVVSRRDIGRVANNKNYIQYECPILVDLSVNQSDLAQVIKTEPYLSINGMGVQLGGVVPLFDIWSAIKSGHRAFELVGTRRELLSTASHHVMFKYGSLVSSNHCQSGIPATVYELQRLRIHTNPRNRKIHAKQFKIKKNGTKKLNRYIRGVRKQSHARTQSRIRTQ